MDPDKIVQELREWYNAIVQDGEVQGDPMDNLEEVLVLFDDLDNWIIGGGFLPKEWRR